MEGAQEGGEIKTSSFSLSSRLDLDLLGEDVEVGLGDDTGTGVDRGLHLGDLRVDVLHKLNNEIDQLVLVHSLGVEVGDEERDIVSLDGLTTQDHEGLGTLSQETHKLLGQQLLQLIGLLNSNGDSQRVDGSLNQNFLLRSTRDDDRVQQEFGRRAVFGLNQLKSIANRQTREVSFSI